VAHARPYWKGYLKLSLVSCPIALYPAISAAEKVSFRQVNRRSGNRLRHQLVDSVTGEAVDHYDKGRGYEVGENRFVMVEEEDLEAARAAPPVPPSASTDRRAPSAESTPAPKPHPRHVIEDEPEDDPEQVPQPFALRPKQENTRTIEIEHFVPRVQLDPAFFEKPYFVLPRDQVGQEAYAVIRDAMRRKDMMGIGYVVLSSLKRPIALEPLANGIRGITLRHIEDMRSPADYFGEIPELQLPPEMLQLAEHIVGTKARDFNPEFLTDHYRAALIEMLKEKRAALPMPELPAAASEQNVVSLMDALKRSLAVEEAKAPEQPASTSKKPKKRATGQREMLLPITGKGTGKEKAKEPARPAARQRKAS
jgi:non-homologous end joining protein Ku